MGALYIKEIRTFLGSITGYMTIIIFLLATGLFMWLFPGEANVFTSGKASLSPLFFNAPMVFLFLIPAITMRSFSEEKKNGTIELLFTKPISDFNIILAKFLASLTLVVLSLLPTLVYYYSVNQLGDPPGNMDHGGTLGAYIGLFFLGAVFSSIGIFASSLTSNQVIAFLLSFIFCFFIYTGFEFVGNYQLFGALDSFILNLGIHAHYIYIMKGVVDSRDILYFLSVISIFLLSTQLSLQSRKW